MSDGRFGGDFEESGENPFSLERIKTMLLRQKYWILVPSLLGLIPALYFPFTLRDVYSSTATVAVQQRPGIMDMGGDFMPGELVGRRNPLGPLLAIAESDQVLGRVVDQLPGERPDPEAASLVTRLRSAVLRLDMSDPPELTDEQWRRRRIDGLRRSVEFDGDNSVIEITATSVRPDSAVFMANAVAEALVVNESAQREEAATKAISFFRTQVFHLREQIGRQKKDIAQLIEDSGINPEAATEREAAQARTQTEIGDAQLRLFEVRTRIDELAPRVQIARQAESEDARRAQLRAQYQKAREDLINAQLTFKPGHPTVIRLDQLVARLDSELGGEFSGPSAASVEELAEYARLQIEERSLATRVTRLRDELRSLTPQTEQASALIEYERMTRELQLDEQNLADLMRRESSVLLEASSQFSNLRVLDRAIPPIGPSGPNRSKYLMLGLVLAIGLGLGVGVGRDFLDQTIRDPEEAVELLGVPILGMIPLVHDGTPAERQSDGPPSSLSAESYRNLRTSLLFSVGASNIGSLVVTSALAGEGKTTVTSNLASSFAQAGRSVLLVDADMRLPRVHKVMGIALSPGLSELIRGDISIDEALRRPADGRFDVITAGRVPPNPSELLASSDFSILLARLKAMYDLVLIDSPVLLGVSDTTIVGSQAEGALLVHRPGSVEKRALREIRSMLTRARVNLIGVAFNKVDRRDRHFYPMYMESPYVSKGKAVRIRPSATRRRFSNQWGGR